MSSASLVHRIENEPPRLGRTIAIGGLLAVLLAAALGVSGALDRSQAAPSVLPPPGQIWFGIAYDPSTHEVYDRATSMSARNSVALVAALRRVTTNAERLTLFYVTNLGPEGPNRLLRDVRS